MEHGEHPGAPLNASTLPPVNSQEMKSETGTGFLARMHRALEEMRLLKLVLYGGTMQPLNADNLMVGETVPEGLHLIHVAPTAAEAELLRDVLREAGFTVAHVPGIGGAFGVRGSTRIYVSIEEGEEAIGFVQEYLNGVPS